MHNPKFYNLDIKLLKNDLKINVGKNNKNIIHSHYRPFFIEVFVSDSFSAFIPIRTNITHKYAFFTKQNGNKKSGLDFTKSYLVKKDKRHKYYKQIQTISKKEYNTIKRNQETLSNKFKNFLILFDKRIRNYDSLKASDRRLIDFSSLQYQKKYLFKCIKEIKKNTDI